MRFLSGTSVVALEQAVAAPACTMRLAQAGADVVKIERPEGDFARGYDTAVAGQSSYFVWLNAGKKSVVLDLRQPEQVDLLRRLIARSDVLVQNLKPGALRKLGLDLTELHQQFPQLISMSISGFAPDGPGHSRKAYDLLMQAESGLSSITGSVHAPGRVGVSLVDIATGQFAYEAILGALIERSNSGRGAALTVSLIRCRRPVACRTLSAGPIRVWGAVTDRPRPPWNLSLWRLYRSVRPRFHPFDSK